MIKKLQLKFVLINMTIVSVMLFAILGLVFYFTSVNLEKESINMMKNIAVQPFAQGSPEELGENIKLPFFIVRLNPQGQLVTTDGGYYDLSDHQFLNDLVQKAYSTNKRFGVIDDYNLRFYRTESTRQLVFTDISSEIYTLDNLIKICVLIGVISFLFFLYVSIKLSKWATKPIEHAWENQKQFIADASHELKTPLTVIITNTELAKMPEYTPEEKNRFLSNISVMSGQMKHLIEQMLKLAKIDNTDVKQSFSKINYSKLVCDSALIFEPIFFENNLTLNTDIDQNIYVNGIESQLRQVLEILLDNAKKYSKQPSEILVKLKKHDEKHCLLTVSNEGEPISESDVQNIFKRFYRANKARTSSGSFGLGLSIAENIINLHKGRIWAESENGINSFHVQLKI